MLFRITQAYDSGSLLYSRAGVLGRQSIQTGSKWEELYRGSRQFAGFSLSRDGKQVLGTEWVPETALWRLMSVALEGSPGVANPVFAGSDQNRRNPAISPDGNWLACVEKSGGLDQVFVQPFPAGGRPLLVSAGASGEGAEPVWGRNSGELFYRDAIHMVSAQLEIVPTLRVKGSTPLYNIHRYYGYLNAFAAAFDYDPSTDRFLMSRSPMPESQGADIQVIENAFELLNRLAPRK